MKNFLVLTLLVLLLSVRATDCSPARQKRHTHSDTHLDDFHNYCFPNHHACLKGHHHLCCSGYCAMIHVGPGIGAISQMKYGKCLSRHHSDKDHHPKKKQQTALQAISG